ncbi:MAG: DUF4493 domain-containing protein [Muribaculaceae bacterium]|nr:DUF4493 domain-containing protein [Muribaculaceae bacterium]
MKKDIKLKAFTFMCSALLLLSGCKDESYPNIIFNDGEGGFSLTELDLDVNTNIPVISRNNNDVDVSDYQVRIVNQATGKPVSNTTIWKYRDMPEVVTLPVGKYRVEVESYDWTDLYAEWEKPHYTGKYDFEVKAGQITKADKVPCNLNNVKVTVQYTDALKNILDDDAKTSVVAMHQQNEDGRQVQLDFGRDETRAGYFRYVEGSNTMVSTLHYTYNNVTNDVYHTITGVSPGQHRIIVYDYVTSDPNGTVSRGDIKIDVKVYSVDVDGTISVKEGLLDDSDRPGHEDVAGPDDPQNPSDPEDAGIDIVNPNAEGKAPYFDLNKVNDVKKEETTGREYKLTINSGKGFQSIKVIIKSHDKGLTPELLEGINLSDEFDLATGLSKDGKDLTEALTGFGFPLKDEVTGANVKKIDFNITQFVPLLCIYPGDHSFVLTVTDKDGNSKQAELKFRAL